MKKSTLVFGLVFVSIFVLGASATERPVLSSCGSFLPKNAHYSVIIEGTWDRRQPGGKYLIGVKQLDEEVDSTIDPMSEELQRFQECTRAAIGMQ